MPPGHAPVRVLVVDDEAVARTFVARTLREAGYDIVTASSGQEAIVAAGEHGRFDLLIADVVMPEMTGDQLAVVLRRTQPDLKVLFLTAHSEQLFATGSSPMQSEDLLLVKPVAVRVLLESVSRELFGHARGVSRPNK